MNRRTSTLKIRVRVGCTVKMRSGVPASRLAYIPMGQTNTVQNQALFPVSAMMLLWSLMIDEALEK